MWSYCSGQEVVTAAHSGADDKAHLFPKRDTARKRRLWTLKPQPQKEGKLPRVGSSDARKGGEVKGLYFNGCIYVRMPIAALVLDKRGSMLLSLADQVIEKPKASRSQNFSPEHLHIPA